MLFELTSITPLICKIISLPQASPSAPRDPVRDLATHVKVHMINERAVAGDIAGLTDAGILAQILAAGEEGVLFSDLMLPNPDLPRSRVTTLAALSFLASLREYGCLKMELEGELAPAGWIDSALRIQATEVGRRVFQQGIHAFDRLSRFDDVGPEAFEAYLRGDGNGVDILATSMGFIPALNFFGAEDDLMAHEAHQVVARAIRMRWGMTSIFGLVEVGAARKLLAAEHLERGVLLSDLIPEELMGGERGRSCAALTDTLRYLSRWGETSLVRLEGKDDKTRVILTPIGRCMFEHPNYGVPLSYDALPGWKGMRNFLRGEDGVGLHPSGKMRTRDAETSAANHGPFFKAIQSVIDRLLTQWGVTSDRPAGYVEVGGGTGACATVMAKAFGNRLRFAVSEFDKGLVVGMNERFQASDGVNGHPLTVVHGDLRSPKRILADLGRAGVRMDRKKTIGVANFILQEAVDFMRIDPEAALEMVLKQWHRQVGAFVASEMYLLPPWELKDLESTLTYYTLFHEGSRQKLFTREQWQRVIAKTPWSYVYLRPLGKGGEYFTILFMKEPLQDAADGSLPDGWRLFHSKNT